MYEKQVIDLNYRKYVLGPLGTGESGLCLMHKRAELRNTIFENIDIRYLNISNTIRIPIQMSAIQSKMHNILKIFD